MFDPVLGLKITVLGYSIVVKLRYFVVGPKKITKAVLYHRTLKSGSLGHLNNDFHKFSFFRVIFFHENLDIS